MVVEHGGEVAELGVVAVTTGFHHGFQISFRFLPDFTTVYAKTALLQRNAVYAIIMGRKIKKCHLHCCKWHLETWSTMHTLGVARILYDWIISSFHTFVNLYEADLGFSMAPSFRSSVCYLHFSLRSICRTESRNSCFMQSPEPSPHLE